MLAAGLLIGCVAAPQALVPELERAIRLTAWSVPSLTVSLACRWIEIGLIDALEEDKRRDARERQQLARRMLRGLNINAHPSSCIVWIALAQGRRRFGGHFGVVRGNPTCASGSASDHLLGASGYIEGRTGEGTPGSVKLSLATIVVDATTPRAKAIRGVFP